jgi:monoterpene epsilon-lactone hydrolase
MQSIRSRVIYNVLKLVGSPFAVRNTLAKQRATMERQSKYLMMPPKVEVEPFFIGDIYVEWIKLQKSNANGAILYLHGGGYTMGSCNTHRALAARIAVSSQLPALLINYRLAPENPFPAALEDAIATYSWLVNHETEGASLFIVGDSSGGGLALAAAIILCDRKEHHPSGIVCISPWADLTMSGETVKTCSNTDPLISLETSKLHASRYAPQQDLKSPLISPVFADLKGLPALLIQVGEHEILLNDSIRISENARLAGVEVNLEVWDGMWHDWHMFAGLMPESQMAINRIGRFITERANH